MDVIEERTATLRSGIALPYAETGRSGDSLPVVVVHAFVESWRYVEPLLRALPPSIYAVVPTQRGHPSVKGNPASYRIEDFARDTVDFLDVLGIDRAVLVGTSSGGVVAQVLARHQPQLLAGLVLISSPVTLADKPGVSAMRDDIMALSDPVDPHFVEQFVRGTSPQDISAELVARLVQESRVIPADVWRASLLGLLKAEGPEGLADISVPTLLLSGSRDGLVADDQQVLLDRIPDVELVVYAGLGHGPHLTHPERVAADVAAFVHRQQASG